MNDLRAALNRTLLLMRDDLERDIPDDTLLAALTGTRIALVADAATLISPAAQTAFITAALLCVRSGHAVGLLAPDVLLAAIQPPLSGTSLIGALMEMDGRIVPARRFAARPWSDTVDLEIRFGTSAAVCAAQNQLTVSATPWSTTVSREISPEPWPRDLDWPIGSMAGATLAAAEAFKCAMRKLRPFARDPRLFDEFFRPVGTANVVLAPPNSPLVSDLGLFDLISGGAITNGTLYALSRLPRIRGAARVIEPDFTDTSNLNRYMLLLLDHLDQAKANHLAGLPLGGLSLKPLPWRFATETSLGTVAGRVLVGVDHIPTRWAVQRANPRWIGVGATTHWSAMASCHTRDSSCAGCAHPRDDVTPGPIPTVAFVSFMAALLQTADFLQSIGAVQFDDRQSYLTLPRPENLWRAAIARHAACPIGHGQSLAA